MSTTLPHAAADEPRPADDRHPAEEAARAAERDLRLILDSFPVLVSTTTPAGEVDFANQPLLDYLGVSLDQLQSWPGFIHELDRSMVTERWTHSAESGLPFEADYRLRRSDGVYRWFHGRAVPVHSPDGSIARWYNLEADIEDRKRAEDLLRSSDRQIRAIIDNIPAQIVIHNASGEVELDNRAAREFHGRSRDDIEQWQAGDVVHPDDLPGLVAAHQRALATGEPLELEYRIRRADGEYRWFQIRSLRASDDYDGTSRWYTVGTDIHDRKTAEDEVRRSEARLLEVQRLSRTGAWRYDLARASSTARRRFTVRMPFSPVRTSHAAFLVRTGFTRRTLLESRSSSSAACGRRRSTGPATESCCRTAASGISTQRGTRSPTIAAISSSSSAHQWT